MYIIDIQLEERKDITRYHITYRDVEDYANSTLIIDYVKGLSCFNVEDVCHKGELGNAIPKYLILKIAEKAFNIIQNKKKQSINVDEIIFAVLKHCTLSKTKDNTFRIQLDESKEKIVKNTILELLK